MAKNRNKKAEGPVNVEENVYSQPIPAEEIWTYTIEGLQAPRIKDKHISAKIKVVIVFVIVVAISISIYLSIRAVHKETYKYGEAKNGGYELIKYSNPNKVTSVDVDYAYNDPSRPVTALHEYAFNCDEKLVSVSLGKDIKEIDGKAFYSCRNLENIFVDDANPYYCDINGVLYDKGKTEIICYPDAHNIYLAKQSGYDYTLPEDGSINNDDFNNAVMLLNTCRLNGTDMKQLKGDGAKTVEKLTRLTGVKDYEAFIDDYNKKVGFYVLPSTVTKIGKLAFSYTDITGIFIPEGVKIIETMAFFKCERLGEIYSYTSEHTVADTVFESASKLLNTYKSLPEGLLSIGSDAFTWDRGITYMFIPSSVTEIGHHAFFNMVYKEDGKLIGLSEMSVAADMTGFSKNTRAGDSWLPKYDSNLFKKNIDVVYSASRQN